MGNIYDTTSTTQQNKTNLKERGILYEFGVDLTSQAELSKLDPVHGRDESVERLINILGRRRKNNPILIGDPGVGKSAIIELLAQNIVKGNVPISLLNKRIFNLDLGLLIAGTKFRGEFEERLTQLIEELKASPDVIVFIDEIHQLVGLGGGSGQLDASNLIKPALARGEIRCIGATTHDEYRTSIERNGALARRFQPIIIGEPNAEDTIKMLMCSKIKYEEFHKITYTDAQIKLIVNLAQRYISSRKFPDKAFDILDELGSFKNNLSFKKSPKLILIEDSINELTKQKIKAVEACEYVKANGIKFECNKLQEQYKNELEKATGGTIKTVTDDEILKVVSKITSIPLEKLNSKEHAILSNLPVNLKKQVIGQDDAVDTISLAIQKNRVGLTKYNKTQGNFIFAGPSGVGKTLLVKQLAHQLFGSDKSIIRYDMSEFMEQHSVSKLIGSPPGYVGYDNGGSLTESIKKQPYSIILFDEIEKAHPAVFDVFLQLLDEGRLTDSHNTTVDFKNCIIIMTTNLGAAAKKDRVQVGFSKTAVQHKLKSNVLSAITERFRPEFINRIDEIIVFNSLTKEHSRLILENELNELRELVLNSFNCTIKFGEDVKLHCLEKGFNETYGARNLQRTIEKLIVNGLTQLYLANKDLAGSSILCSMKNDAIDFKIKKSKKQSCAKTN